MPDGLAVLGVDVMTGINAGEAPLPELLASVDEYQQRLELILPQSVTGVTFTANRAAAATVFTAMYVGAIENTRPLRPSTVTWMSDAIAKRREDDHRKAYYAAAIRSEKAVRDFCASFGYERGAQWYAGDTREQVRDDSIKALKENGAILTLTNVITTSSRPRYTLEFAFATLMAPELTGEELVAAIAQWQSTHLTPVGRQRAAQRNDASLSVDSVTITLPEGGTRALHPGPSSQIIKGVVEHFATARLRLPSVLFISQPGEKLNPLDAQRLNDIGLSVDQALLLPDCIIADLAEDRGDLWFVEAVATDGPITAERKQKLLDWAASQDHPAERCQFLTAFQSRTASAAKKALPRLANGSHAWFVDEPGGLLSWDELERI